MTKIVKAKCSSFFRPGAYPWTGQGAKNTRLSRQKLSNALAYFAAVPVTKEKKFYKIVLTFARTTMQSVKKLFSHLINLKY